jgi:hypothetical protein
VGAVADARLLLPRLRRNGGLVEWPAPNTIVPGAVSFGFEARCVKRKAVALGNQDISGSEAWHRLQGNSAGRWASGPSADPAEGTAWQRINAAPFFAPVIKPEFSISSTDRIFALGSCFARHVEGALFSLGFTVESLTADFDEFEVKGPKNTPIGFMNKYNTESIYNELLWALEPDTEFPAEALVQLDDDLWSDPHTSPALGHAGLDVTLRRHRLMTDVVRRVADCRVVVITLGLVETFVDTLTGLYTNSTPPLNVQRERFRFRSLSHEQLMDGLERIHRILTEHGHPDLHVLATVSPVPLDATFTGEDVVVANTLSKSLLRAAAGQWAARHENVHYFPSYEIVMNSRREDAWERDGRHVRFELVHHVMSLFAEAHVNADVPPMAVEA